MTSPLPHPSLIGDIDDAIARILGDLDDPADDRATVMIASTALPGLSRAVSFRTEFAKTDPEPRGWRRWAATRRV